MRLPAIRRSHLGMALGTLLFLILAISSARAQDPTSRPWFWQRCPPPPCLPAPTIPPQQPQQPQQPQTPTTATPEAPTQPSLLEPSLTPEQSVATSGETVALAAPNMLGNLLGVGNSLSFASQFECACKNPVLLTGMGPSNVIFNMKIGDNNSPLPQDRVYFRYNFFANSAKVTGDSGLSVLDPALGLTQTSGPRFMGIASTKNYDTNEFTFGGEKTFFNGQASIELRVPFSNTLANNLGFSPAEVTGIGVDSTRDVPTNVIQTTPTPQNTFGSSDTEFGDMAIILKGLLYRTSTLAISTGLGIGIPTAQDTKVTVTDFLSDGFNSNVELERLRQFRISNNTWALSPYVGFLSTPNDRFFTQGFLEFDVPVNKSTVSYSQQALLNTEPGNLTLTPTATSESIRDQTLMQVDLGVGYWLVRNPGSSWLTAVAPTIELHYTTTLDNADIITLPGTQLTPTLAIPEPNPTAGNLRNRTDLLDLTVGTTFVIGDRATLATGFAFPLKTGDNRTYDWEFLFQLNYYFGVQNGSGRRFAPNF
ncbi:MAG TPA: hypothetical protein VK395_38220 [Gemmataceae bacterium]|nr:hypothetical protein [Gemmataceae bacterium]